MPIQPYVPPGTTITEAVAPQVVPLLSSTAEIVLVGLSLGHQTRTDQVVLKESAGAGVPVVLPGIAAIPGSVLETVTTVYSAVNPAEGGNEGKGFKTEAYKVTKAKGEIELVPGKGITPGTLVNVTYTFVPGGYYNPVRLFNFNEVQNRFGNAIENGLIASPLSLAAQKAFENGAGSIICQPLFRTSTGAIKYSSLGNIENGEQPNTTQGAEKSVWETTFQALNMVEGIDLLVPVVGQSQEHVGDSNEAEIFNAVLGYELQRNGEEQYIYGVFGEDSTTGTGGAMSTIRTHASNLRAYAGESLAQQNTIINTSNFSIALPAGGTLAVGGQFMAAAVAGALASRPVASSLTRKNIVGFTSVNDIRTPAQKNEDAGNGEMVIEQIAGNVIRCRHALSLDNLHGASRSEVSVVRAKFLMIESIRQTLENQVIGQIIADGNSPIIVRSAIVGVLSALQSAGDIVDFATPVVAIATLEPTTINASFSYRPAFTLNYINITFALDLSSQSVALVETS